MSKQGAHCDITKPCPFCGDDNCLTEPYYDESYVRCQKCGADGPTGDYEECVRLWNIRVKG